MGGTKDQPLVPRSTTGRPCFEATGDLGHWPIHRGGVSYLGNALGGRCAAVEEGVHLGPADVAKGATAANLFRGGSDLGESVCLLLCIKRAAYWVDGSLLL